MVLSPRKRGGKTRRSTFLLSMIWVMFALSTVHWCIAVAWLTSRVVGEDVEFHSIMDAIGKINVSSNFDRYNFI